MRHEARSSSGTAKGGIGFLGMLTIVFITLKLTGYIHWSWWWVLSPILIPAAITGMFVLVAILLTIVILWEENGGRRK